MSMTFAPSVMSTEVLEAFRLRYPEGVTDFSDPDILWPEPDKILNDAWHLILRENDEWQFSLNLSNSNAITLLKSLSVELEHDPEGYVIQYSGRIELEDLIDRCRTVLREDALRGGFTKNPEYLQGRVIDLFEVALRCVGRGFTHMTWG